MARAPRLLVIEGNTARARAKQTEFLGRSYSEGYSDVLRAIVPDAAVDICFPADEGANVPDAAGLDGYDGVAITGSALNAYESKPEIAQQVDLVRTIYETGVPIFGSCWGLQIGALAAGGSVVRSPKGREIGLARKIVLTDAGRDHPMHKGKKLVFDAPAVHTDEVGEKPDGMTVTATNAFSEVQAAEIRHGKSVFWGVQYHPEFTLAEMAAIIRRYGKVLVDEGPFRDLDQLGRHAADLSDLQDDPARTEIAWRLGYDIDVLDPDTRLAEIRNWLERLVLPTMSGRGRA